MYDIIKSVITDRGYNLTDMLNKIDTLFTNMGELAETIKSLAGRVALLEGQDPTPEPEPEEYPAWEPWGGVGPIPWQTGSKCSHKDKRWVSQVDNNIWEPGAEGVHETIWRQVN